MIKNYYLYSDLYIFFYLYSHCFSDFLSVVCAKKVDGRDHVFGQVWPALLLKAVGLMN